MHRLNRWLFGDIPAVKLSGEWRRSPTQEELELDRREFDNVVLAAELLKFKEAYAQLREENQELKRVALVEPLTGLFNRRGEKEELARALAPYARQAYGHKLAELAWVHVSVIVIDVDDFKAINDTHGHAAGDRTLKTIAAHVVREFRASDVVVRFGGDEIVVYAIGAPQDAVLSRAQEFQAALASDTELNAERHVSCSVGIAHGKFKTERGARQLIDLLRKSADDAMYQAKKKMGKGCIATAPDDTLCAFEDL
ncbi:MAG: GGDEF domain-containing protein [Candidatus Moraniibacteriota bacterium]